MALDKQKAFLFKQIEIVTMVLTKLYFLTDAIDYFGYDIGVKDEDTNDDAVKYELWRKKPFLLLRSWISFVIPAVKLIPKETGKADVSSFPILLTRTY